jgi:chromosome segregation ATPase
MAQVLNLKELRSSSALKAEIQKLEENIQQLKEQMGRQKLLEKKLSDDIVNHKKDFDHLEKQFAHFAGLETEFEELQQELQMERLEKLINGDKKDNQVNVQVKKARDDLVKVQAELKEFKKLDPLRLKRQVTDLKKKNIDQAKDNKNLSSALVTERKEVKELTSEKDRLEAEVEASNKQTNFFWESEDSKWALYETALVLNDETQDEESLNRILCLNRETGVSIVSKALGDDDKAVWVNEMDIPDEIAIEAGKRLKMIAAEDEEEEDDD